MGANTTYRSVIGKTLAAYQAAGLLPFPGISSTILSANEAKTHAPGSGSTYSMYQPNYLSELADYRQYNGDISPFANGPMYNLYAATLAKYVNVYTYAYSDYLGQEGSVTFNPDQSDKSGKKIYTDAFPITITVY